MNQKIKLIIRSIVVLTLFWFSSLLQYIPIYFFHLDVKTLTMEEAVLLSVFSSVVLAFILFFLYRKDLKKEFHIYRKKLGENFDIGLKCWFIGFLIMIVSNAFLIFFFHLGGAENQKIVQKMIEAIPWIMIIDTAIIAPFNEEIVFRKTLKDIIPSKWLFVICSFLLFGGAHVISTASSWVDYLYIIPYGALGGAFAYAYWESDTIFTSMVMHMLHNLALTALMLFL